MASKQKNRKEAILMAAALIAVVIAYWLATKSDPTQIVEFGR